MSHPDFVLALDLTLGCGVALFDRTGRLLTSEALGKGGAAKSRQAAADVLAAGAPVKWLVSSGSAPSQAVWERHAMRRGVRVQRAEPGDWQAAMLPRGVAPTPASILALAGRLCRQAGHSLNAPLSLSEAKAICMGHWACTQLGLCAPHAMPSLAAAPAPAARPVERLRQVA